MVFKLADLEALCSIHEPESLKLEFKPCNELRQGVIRKQGEPARAHDDVVTELSRDVSAFLNADGGTIVYGITERRKTKKSVAEDLDRGNAFTGGDKQTPEWLTQLIRKHISPPPSLVNIYQIGLNDVSWFLAAEIPQGQTAFQAKNKCFYKRIGCTVQPMEQYEIADAMRREKGAALELRLTPEVLYPRDTEAHFGVRVEVTSRNYISAEHGAIKFSLVPPLTMDWELFRSDFRQGGQIVQGEAQFQAPQLKVGSKEVDVEACKISWGANHGNIVFPDDWYNFYGTRLQLVIRCLTPRDQTYGIAAELYTINTPPRRQFFLLHKQAGSIDIEPVNEGIFEQFLVDTELQREVRR
jgi:hypothetical protein